MHLWQAVLCMPAGTVSCEQGLNQQIFIINMKSSSLSLETLECLVLILPINLDVAMGFSLFQMERSCLKREELKVEFSKTYDPCEFVECDMLCIPPFYFIWGYYFLIVFNVHKCVVASTLWLMLSHCQFYTTKFGFVWCFILQGGHDNGNLGKGMILSWLAFNICISSRCHEGF
jgi:hypothetical protein